ncbi:MAG: hypothetical protein NZ518_01465, partial [Dehalococcoidia bacterium]|nr:hypothetical protein [Dehalococcoidia bacterium]
EAAIAAGQCFLFIGAASALWAIDARRAWPRWALAGAAFGLALASRASLLPALVALGVAAVVWTARRRDWASLVAFVGPLATIGGVIGWANDVRFGSPLEFGQRYQLTNLNLHRDYGAFFSLDYLPRNLAYFFVRPFALESTFPFIGWLPAEPRSAAWASTTAPIVEPVIGLLWTTPFALLGLGALAGWRSRRWPLVALLAGVAVAAALPVLLQRWVTMRYLADFAPLLTALGATGALLAWQPAGGLRRGSRWWRMTLGAGVGVFGAVSIALGLLLGVRGYDHHFARNNPALFAALGGAPLPERPTDLRVAIDNAQLIAYRFDPPVIGPGEQTTLALTWRLRGQTDVALHARVVTMDFQPVASATIPVPSGDGVVEQRVPLRIVESTPPGYLEVEVEARSATGAAAPMRTRSGEPIDRFTMRPIRVPWRGPWPPDGFLATDVRFGEPMRLAGARVERDDDTVVVTLAWSAGRLDDDRIVDLTLTDSAGRVVATSRGAPGGGRLMTRLWRLDEKLRDEWELAVPHGLPPGPYWLRVQVADCAGPIRPRGDPVLGPFTLR